MTAALQWNILDRSISGTEAWRDWGTALAGEPAELVGELRRQGGYLRLRSATSYPDIESAGASLVNFGARLGEVLFQDDDQSWFARVEEISQASRRGSKTARALIYHSDIGRIIPDLVLLYTVRASASGGESSIIGIGDLVAELRRTAPDILPVLATPWWIDGSMTGTPSKASLLRRPVLEAGEDGLRVSYNRARIERGSRLVGQPLTQDQQQALDILDQALAVTGPVACFRSAPGELLILDNQTTLHSRTSFAGDGSPEHERLLLRIWVRSEGD